MAIIPVCSIGSPYGVYLNQLKRKQSLLDIFNYYIASTYPSGIVRDITNHFSVNELARFGHVLTCELA